MEMEVAMKRVALFIIALFSFGILSANCAAPVELMLENTTEAPQTVHLTYGYDTAGSGNEGIDDTVAYRARQEGNELIIRKITINGIFTMDIGTDPCVPAGTWTYVIPFSCNDAACWCQNYADITIPEHGANCIDTSEPGDITAEEFAAKQRNESWYESPDYEYPEDEPVVDDDPVIKESEPFADDVVYPDDAPAGIDIGNDQNDEIVPVNDSSSVTDTDMANSVEKKESSVGCSLIIL